jgi:hypothetical protein
MLSKRKEIIGTIQRDTATDTKAAPMTCLGEDRAPKQASLSRSLALE